MEKLAKVLIVVCIAFLAVGVYYMMTL